MGKGKCVQNAGVEGEHLLPGLILCSDSELPSKAQAGLSENQAGANV